MNGSKNQKNPSSKIKGYAFRLRPHDDLKQCILQFASHNELKAGAIHFVGSLEQFNIRFANQPAGAIGKGFFEIISLTGTFSESSCHLHICLSDEKGQTLGGHLLEENLIYTTAEISRGKSGRPGVPKRPQTPRIITWSWLLDQN